ncbi:hypothetical protein ACG7TL_005388 [Trametes sanguinea]
MTQTSILEPNPANNVRKVRQTDELKIRAPPKPPPDRVEKPSPTGADTLEKPPQHTTPRIQASAMVAAEHVVLPSALDLISRVDRQAGGCFAPPLVVKKEQIEPDIHIAKPFAFARPPAVKRSENLPPLSSIFSEEIYQVVPLVASNADVQSSGRRTPRYHPYDRMKKCSKDDTVVKNHRIQSPTPSTTSRPSTASSTPSPPSTPPPLTPPPAIAHRWEPPAPSKAFTLCPTAPQSLSNVTRPIPPLAVHAGSVDCSSRGHIHWIPFFAHPDGTVSPCVMVDSASPDCCFPGCSGTKFMQRQLSKPASFEREADSSLNYQNTRRVQVHRPKNTLCARLQQNAVEGKDARRVLLSGCSSPDQLLSPGDPPGHSAQMIPEGTNQAPQDAQKATKDIHTYGQGNPVVVVDIPPQLEPQQLPLKFVMFDPQGSWPRRPHVAKPVTLAG